MKERGIVLFNEILNKKLKYICNFDIEQHKASIHNYKQPLFLYLSKIFKRKISLNLAIAYPCFELLAQIFKLRSSIYKHKFIIQYGVWEDKQ